MPQNLYTLISNDTENGGHRTRCMHSNVGDYGSLNPRRTQKTLFKAQRNTVLLPFSSHTRYQSRHTDLECEICNNFSTDLCPCHKFVDRDWIDERSHHFL